MTEKIILSGRTEQELYKEFCNLACNDLEGAKSKIQQFSDDELRIYQEIILSVSESATIFIGSYDHYKCNSKQCSESDTYVSCSRYMGKIS